MITRVILALAAGAGLAACQPAIPDSGSGVGFDGSFEAQQAQRDAELAGAAVPAPAVVTATPIGAAPVDDGSAEATAARTAAVLAATGGNAGVGYDPATNGGVAPVAASPSNPAPAAVDVSGISQENNFDAVSAQRGIESDAARIAANRAQYQVVTPQALPERVETGPNIVAYALASDHPRGTQIYPRRNPSQEKFLRACADFQRADQAQTEFLTQGGPEKDRLGMDPDGDGYACNWDPTPFRRARTG